MMRSFFNDCQTIGNGSTTLNYILNNGYMNNGYNYLPKLPEI